MKETTIVWREEIRKNDFHCNRCGAKLVDAETGQPDPNAVLIAGDIPNALSCITCGKPVAFFFETTNKP